VLEKIYDEFPRDTGIYGSFAQKPNLVGLPYVLEVWKKDLPELPPRLRRISAFGSAADGRATASSLSPGRDIK
jgi:hypothetical protein